jgi:hypothetical protein
MADVSGVERGSGPSVRRLILGTQLRNLRERAGITCAEAGFSIRNSGSKISRLETGRISFKERDVADLLTLYGVADPSERERFLSLARQSRQVGWWHRYDDLMPKWFEDFVGLEEAAFRIQTYELQFVPGLLQTEAYAHAITAHGRPSISAEDVERIVALRMQRQKALVGPEAARLWTVVDESVLHRPIGGRSVLRAQIDRMLELSALAHISIQVLPYRMSGYAADGSFTLLRFAEPELPDIAYIEHLTGALYLERSDDLEVYSRALDRLAVDAETPERSRQLLSRIRADI